MGCKCQCGNEYGFDPIGFWVCHACHSMNDSGPVGKGGMQDVPEPERVDELTVGGEEFAARADASVRTHPDSWKAWYALGATYASRGNVFEAGLVWAKAASLIDDSETLRQLIGRCSASMSGCIVRVFQASGKCNSPYAIGLEYVCVNRLDGSTSFCEGLYDGLMQGSEKLVPSDAFAIVNLSALVMLQRMAVVSDIREHTAIMRRIASGAETFPGCRGKTLNPVKRMVSKKSAQYTDLLAEPFRVALCRVEEAIGRRTDAELDELASKQPCDGTAGFTDRLSKAVMKGTEVAYMRATRAPRGDIEAAEAEMSSLIDEYVSMYFAGDQTRLMDEAVYTG